MQECSRIRIPEAYFLLGPVPVQGVVEMKEEDTRGGFRRSPYAVLNIPRSCDHGAQKAIAISSERIRESYKRLSRLLHPDKRLPGEEQEDAQEMFIEVQHACESLIVKLGSSIAIIFINYLCAR